MSDVHDPYTRSYNMSRIRGKDSKPELIVRRFLHSNGVRYRLHDKRLPGKPDIVLRKYKTVVFVNGCFWHGHDGCSYFKLPKTNHAFWEEKINDTKQRDIAVLKNLSASNWTVVIIWECELKKQFMQETLSNLLIQIKENELH